MPSAPAAAVFRRGHGGQGVEIGDPVRESGNILQIPIEMRVRQAHVRGYRMNGGSRRPPPACGLGERTGSVSGVPHGLAVSVALRPASHENRHPRKRRAGTAHHVLAMTPQPPEM